MISIALMLMIVTAVGPTDLQFSIFSGLTTGLSADELDPFMSGMHLALWILVAFSLAGAAVSALRGPQPVHAAEPAPAQTAGRPPRMGTRMGSSSDGAEPAAS